jgi:glycosyltransferase involved in cell wall biosynthesis
MARMDAHCHADLRAALRTAIERYRPDIVQVEHVELAALVDQRMFRERWVLSLHDAFTADDFQDAGEGRRFQRSLDAYDAIAVCSPDDAAMIRHPGVHCIPNGARAATGYSPSRPAQMLFMGPFRYANNLEGIRTFLRVAFPAIRAAVPEASLLVLGGDEAPAIIRGEAAFAQPGVRVYTHREDVPDLLRDSALTVNPLAGIRGSAVKLIESLAAGRVCVTTQDGARGFRDAHLEGLFAVDSVPEMVDPIVALLTDEALRHRAEAPQAAQLAPFRWEHSAGLQRALYETLLATP